MLHNIFLLHSYNTKSKKYFAKNSLAVSIAFIFRSTTVSKFSVSGLPATSGLSLPQTDQQSEAGAAARVWLRPSEVFGLDWDFVCQRAQEIETKRERETVTIKLLQRQSVCLGDGWGVLYMCMRVCQTVLHYLKFPENSSWDNIRSWACVCMYM